MVDLASNVNVWMHDSRIQMVNRFFQTLICTLAIDMCPDSLILELTVETRLI